jgi:hypothetical protein
VVPRFLVEKHFSTDIWYKRGQINQVLKVLNFVDQKQQDWQMDKEKT